MSRGSFLKVPREITQLHHLTMICCVSAAGDAHTPLFILKGKQRLKNAIKEYEEDGFAARASASGYTTTADMDYYLEHVFIPDQVLHIMSPYPSSTDVTQPLGLTVFKQMKDAVCNTIRNHF